MEESKKATMPALFNLQATDVEDDDVIGRKQRAMTDQFSLTPQKPIA